MKQPYLVLILKGLVMIWTSMDEELDKNFEIRNCGVKGRLKKKKRPKSHDKDELKLMTKVDCGC